MSTLLIGGIFVFLVVAGTLYYSAFEQVRPKLPAQFRDPHAARFALDNFIWERLYPAHVRRTYLLSVAATAAAFACGATLLSLRGDTVPAVIAWGLVLLALGYGIRRAIRYRNRLVE